MILTTILSKVTEADTWVCKPAKTPVDVGAMCETGQNQINEHETTSISVLLLSATGLGMNIDNADCTLSGSLPVW